MIYFTSPTIYKNDFVLTPSNSTIIILQGGMGRLLHTNEVKTSIRLISKQHMNNQTRPVIVLVN